MEQDGRALVLQSDQTNFNIDISDIAIEILEWPLVDIASLLMRLRIAAWRLRSVVNLQLLTGHRPSVTRLKMVE